MDLLNPLEDAEIFWNTVYIDVGSPNFHDALVGGWNKDRAESSGLTFAKATSKNSYIVFYVFEPTDRTLQVKCKGISNLQTLYLSVNGKALKPQQIETRYGKYSFVVPKAFLRPGKNYLEIHSLLQDRSRAAVLFDEVRFLGIGSISATADKMPIRGAFQKAPNERSAMHMPVPGAIVEYFLVPESSALQLEYQLPPNAKSSSAAKVAVYLDDRQAQGRILSSRTLRNRFLGSRSSKETIPLKDYANKIVRLKLQAVPIDGSPVPESIDWVRVGLNVIPAAAPKEEKKQASAAIPMKKPGDVIIYLVDCLRGDHLQPYGYKHSTSPFIAEFAKDSVIFRNAYSQAPWTRPSIASIFTGLYPSSHGTEGWRGLFPPETPTIASQLKSVGFTTYGFVTNINISNTFGFGKDFDHYTYFAEDRAKEGVYLSSDKLYEKLNAFLTAGMSQPAFLYIHAMDPHEPYHPGSEFATAPESCKGDLEDIYSSAKSLYARACDENLAECLTTLYDGEVRKSDYYFGQFLKRLKDLGLYDDSMILLTADHGESFCEHHKLQHGRSVYQSEIRVPLIVKFPGRKFGGREVPQVARHIDVFPTMLESVGLKIPQSLEGRSLLDLLEGRNTIESPVFAELNLDNLRKKAFVFEKWKLIENREKLEYEPGRYELYDISRDPQEKSDLSIRDPILLGYIEKMYRQLSRLHFKHMPSSNRPEATIDKDTEEALKALGYLQ